MDEQFQHALNAQVAIAASGETGEVIGRAQYATTENQYLVRYKAGDGRAVEHWWSQSALIPA